MATSIIEILIKAKDETAATIRALKSQLDNLQTKGSTQAGEGLAGIGAGAKTAATGISDLQKELDTLGGSLPNVIGAAKTLFNSFVAFKGVQLAKGLAETTARADVLGTVLGVVGSNAGVSSADLKKMDEAVQRLGITIQSSRESLTKLLQANLVNSQTSYKAAELARAAQDLAVTAGRDSSETLSRMVLNIQQLDTVGLRWQGLIVDRTKGEAEYARAIGKTANALTKQEQQQAFLNATLEAASTLSGAYEQSMADAGKQLQSLNRLSIDFRTALGESLQPAFLALIEVYGDFLKEATKIVQSFDESGQLAAQFGQGLRAVAEDVKAIALVFVEWASVLVPFAAIWAGGKLVAGVALFARMAGIAAISTTSLWTQVVALNAALLATPAAAGDAAVAISGFGLATRRASAAFALIGGAVGAVLGAIAAAFAGWEFGTFLRGFRAVQEAAYFVVAALMSIVTPLEGVYAAFQSFKNGLITLFTDGPEAAIEAFMAPIREWVSKLPFSFTELKAAWKDLWDGGVAEEAEATAAAMSKGQEIVRESAKLTEELYQAKKKLDALRETNAGGGIVDQAELAEAEAAVKTIQEKQEKLTKEMRSLLAGTTVAVKEQLKSYANDMKIPAAVAASELEKFRAKKQEWEKTLGFEKLSKSNAGISAEFEKITAAAKGLIELNFTPFERNLRGSVETIGSSFEITTATIKKWWEAAKSPEELALFLSEMDKLKPKMDSIGMSFETLFFELEQLKLSASVEFDTTSIKEMEEKTKGLSTRLKELKDSYQTVADVQKQSEASSQEFVKTLLSFGAPLLQAQQGFLNLNQSFAKIKDNSKNLSSLSTTALVTEQGRLDKAYKENINNLEAVAKKQKELADVTYETASTSRRVIAAVDKNLTQQRITIAKEYYKQLGELRKQARESYAASLSQLVALDKELFDLKEAQKDFNRGLRRQEMTDDQAYYDRLNELAELSDQAKRAAANGELDFAKDLNKKRISLAQELASAEGIDPYIARRASAQAYNAAVEDQSRIIVKQRDITRENALQQLAVYQQLTQAVESLGKTITGASKEQQVKIMAELDSESAKTVSQELDLIADKKRVAWIIPSVDGSALENTFTNIKNKLESTTINIKAKVTTTGTTAYAGAAGGYVDFLRKAIVRAAGGHIRGPGTETSDSVPAWLSDNEYVIQAKAVRKYGVNFLHMLNNMRLPTFSMGGLASIARAPVYNFVPRYATGGLVSAPMEAPAARAGREVVDINLKMGNRKVSLMAEREQARGLIDLLNAVEGVR
jgi:hypothetical protein